MPSHYTGGSLVANLLIGTSDIVKMVGSFPTKMVAAYASTPDFVDPQVVWRTLWTTVLPIVPEVVFLPFGFMVFSW